MKVLVIDNYDSFTYNIVQYIGETTGEILVCKNDEITTAQIRALKPSHIVVSPGPSWPENAGISKQAITAFMKEIPILGVCLGHQCMIEALGGKIKVNYRIMHGKVSPVYHDKKGVYAGMKNPFNATRYHSLVGDKKTLPKELIVSARTKEGEIMGVRHKKYPMEGVQFHPESVLTEDGKKLIRNFLKK
ncbi:MAG TPA: aminodeoxychorismate/anthranilate synthase component II [Candidatus Goldiibacteriota bacterium]|nr:aminodeoxychorismate/anthranilate synthase component II [Candidatus Goldiibacteriota bacterium]